MIRNDPRITSLIYGDMVEKLANQKCISISEARQLISEMSFLEYRALEEATLVQPTNTFSTIKSTYPNPIQVKQTREPTPDNDSIEQFGTLTDPHDQDARADKVAKQRDRQATIQNKDQPQQDQPGKVTLKQEDITPPSGDTIGPSTGSNQTSGATPQVAPGGIKSLWPGKGVPAAVGMTVGLKGPSGLPIPGMITQVDNAAKGVKVKNPTTGQEEWTNTDNLQPYIAQGQHQSQTAAPAQPDVADAQRTMEGKNLREFIDNRDGSNDEYEDLLFTLAFSWWGSTDYDTPFDSTEAERKLSLMGWKPDMGDDYVAVVLSKIGGNGHRQYTIDEFEEAAGEQDMDEELSRLLELSGIQETCSAGATGAGAIATAPMAMGNIKRRVSPVAELKHEYTPKEGAKTVVGDTKPNQASGQLSANLAASGKATASRINNGRKRRR